MVICGSQGRPLCREYSGFQSPGGASGEARGASERDVPCDGTDGNLTEPTLVGRKVETKMDM